MFYISAFHSKNRLMNSYQRVFIQNGRAFRAYVAGGVNNTWSYVGRNIVLDNLNQTLTGGVIDVGFEYSSKIQDTRYKLLFQVG
ncbi:hypothetical protein DPMN_011617 [Dreissena polymorpha]|uniref:Uncharacterized protein n=1 Tax=Dreissena polymorpha TaxID=45954 RepID=A0A9D4N5F5_DREPO|nr:hypothetical protein DPMN_011617 [Dreissena polymorpha]